MQERFDRYPRRHYHIVLCSIDVSSWWLSFLSAGQQPLHTTNMCERTVPRGIVDTVLRWVHGTNFTDLGRVKRNENSTVRQGDSLSSGLTWCVITHAKVYFSDVIFSSKYWHSWLQRMNSILSSLRGMYTFFLYQWTTYKIPRGCSIPIFIIDNRSKAW